MESGEGRLCVLVEDQKPTAVMEVNLSYMYGEVVLHDARVRLWLTQRYAIPFKKALAAQVQNI